MDKSAASYYLPRTVGRDPNLPAGSLDTSESLSHEDAYDPPSSYALDAITASTSGANNFLPPAMILMEAHRRGEMMAPIDECASRGASLAYWGKEGFETQNGTIHLVIGSFEKLFTSLKVWVFIKLIYLCDRT